MPAAAEVEAALRERLQASHVVSHPARVRLSLQHLLARSAQSVVDVSDGCGAKFEVECVSPVFEGKTLLARHRLINDALKEEMKTIHALSIKKAAPA